MTKKLLLLIAVLFIIPCAYADDWPVCIDMLAPEAPSSLSISDKTLSWNAADDEPECSGIDYYEVYKDDVLLGTTSTTSFIDSDVTDGTYSYKIIAYDLAKNKGTALIQSLTISAPTTSSSSGGGGGGGGGGSIITTTTPNNSSIDNTSTTTAGETTPPADVTTTTDESTNDLGRVYDFQDSGSEDSGEVENLSEEEEQEEKSGLLGILGRFGSPLGSGNILIGWMIILLIVVGGTFIFFRTQKKNTP